MEADEDSFRGRLAVNPVIDIVTIGVALAHLVVRLADRRNEFLAVHAHDWLALLDGLLHFRRQRIEPLHGSGTFFGEIQEWRKELLQFVRGEVRHRLIKFQENGAAHTGLQPRRTLILRRGSLHRRITGAAYADLEMIAPVPLAAPAPVRLDCNLIAAKLQPDELHAIASTDGRAVRAHGTIRLLGL